MFIDQVSQCCNANFVVDNGYMVCCSCGVVAQRELDVNHMSFQQSVSKLNPVQYTRTARFSQKVVGALLQATNYKPSAHLIVYLNDARARGLIKNPEDLLVAIGNYKTSARRPYMHATTLWSNMLNTPQIPTLAEMDKRFICLMFEEIFYVWTRLDFEKPRLPMSQAIILIVETFDMGGVARYLIRFLRKLKCPKRTARYKHLFKKCLSHIKHEPHRSRRFENFEPWRRFQEAKGGEELLRAAYNLNA